MNMYIYLKNGNVDIYDVDNDWKAREHAKEIWAGGYRMIIGTRMEWFGPHYIDKICWDIGSKDYLAAKYESSTQSKLEASNG